MEAAVKKVDQVKKAELLDGLGELLDEKQKVWVRENLQKEAIFQLNLYFDCGAHGGLLLFGWLIMGLTPVLIRCKMGV